MATSDKTLLARCERERDEARYEVRQQRALLRRWLLNHLPCANGAAGCDLCQDTRELLGIAR